MILRGFVALTVATLVTTLLASASSTVFVLRGLVEAGAEIPPSLWLSSIVRDWAGFAFGRSAAVGPGIWPLEFVGLAVAFPVAGLLARTARPLRPLFFAAAGFAAQFALVGGVSTVLQVNLISGTLTIPGLLSFCAAGAAGGLLFAALKPARDAA